jgi:predicted transcriptional regulator
VVVATTTKDTVINARIDSETLSQLDELAAEWKRTRSYMIAEAVREFVEREYAFLCAVREGEADFEAGRYHTHDEVKKWVEDLKAGRVTTPPEIPVRKRRRA